MARPRSACGTYSAYRRHIRDGESVDQACRDAQVQYTEMQREARDAGGADRPVRALPDPSRSASTTVDRRAELLDNLEMVRGAMGFVAQTEPAKLAPLSKRHSELLAEIAVIDGGSAGEVDPFDAFLSGSNVVGFPASTARKPS